VLYNRQQRQPATGNRNEDENLSFDWHRDASSGTKHPGLGYFTDRDTRET
jgi:hypothetical protein